LRVLWSKKEEGEEEFTIPVSGVEKDSKMTQIFEPGRVWTALLNVLEDFRLAFRQHPVLATLSLLLLVRLLVHVDSYLTVRDIDFFPFQSIGGIDFDYRGLRPVPLALNLLWSKLAGSNIVVVKHLFARFYILCALPIFFALGARCGMDLRTRLLASILFLGSAPVFALYDSLGPYFLLVILASLQLTLTIAIVDGEDRMVSFGLVSMVGIFSHRVAVLTALICVMVIAIKARQALTRTVGAALVILALVVAGIMKTEASMMFDAFQSVRQDGIYPSFLFLQSDGPWMVAFDVAVAAVSLPARLLGIPAASLPVAVTTLLLGGLLVAYAGTSCRRGLRIYGAAALAGGMALVVLTEYAARDLFFRPNHVTYNTVWLPVLFLFMGTALARLPRVPAYVLLVLLTGVNLWQGYQYRQEAFDPMEFAFATSGVHGAEVEHRLVPAFIPSSYWLHLRELSGVQEIASEEARVNDYTNLNGPAFVLDVVEYDEMGYPMMRYREYEERFLAWARQHGYRVVSQSYRTFRRFQAIQSEVPVSEGVSRCNRSRETFASAPDS
jgi:hypothetical protein